MRIDLPSLYKEVLSIRNSQDTKNKKAKPYVIARFVVEMKTLLQSDFNLDGPKTFTPEPAVIENAKDPRKSIFVPRDLDAGYGEGTYFQAIVFKNQTLGEKKCPLR